MKFKVNLLKLLKGSFKLNEKLRYINYFIIKVINISKVSFIIKM